MSENRPTVKAAVAQVAPVAFHIEATLAKTRLWAAKARGLGAQIVLFPEAFISAYPRGMDFGALIGSRNANGREWFRRYAESSIEANGSAADELAAIARENNIFLVIGVIEREGGTLYCSVLFFSPDGVLLGKHRKVMPTAAERIVWGCGDGSTLPVFAASIGKIGAVICWENYMPLLRTAMYAQGIEIYCAPTADSRPEWIYSMRHIALEGRCFVLSCNQFARRSDYPEDYPGVFEDASPHAIVSRGGSCIIDPFGNILAGPEYDAESLLVADLNLNDILKGKFDLDVVGHYARPDIFQLQVNTKPQRGFDEVTKGDDAID